MRYGHRYNFGHASSDLLQFFISVIGIITNNVTHFFYGHLSVIATFKVTVKEMRHIICNDASNAYKIM